MNSIINAKDALSLFNKGEIILIDATGGAKALAVYQEAHLKGAFFVNLENDLSEIADPAVGGRHPLPSPSKFASLLSRIGVSKQSHLVVYDRMSGANAAARFWWMMKAQGHQAIQVLDGGYEEAIKAGFIAETLVPQAIQSTSLYETTEWALPTMNMVQVDKLTEQAAGLIIDVREAPRYLGLEEPIDLLAGHIPSAVNIPYKQNLNSEGLFKTKEELQDLYRPYLASSDVTKTAVHCGSGVTACHSLLAMDIAGFTLPNLYVGSWSEWSRNKV